MGFEEMMERIGASRNFKRRMRVMRIEMWLERTLRWPRWPFLNVVWGFWTNLMDEGIAATCKPRWGMLTFAWLNDGIKPSLWHTLRQITHDQTDPYTGIYTHKRGAPRSLAEAQQWEREWAEERETEEV